MALVVSSIDWTNVLVALIAGLPAIIAAVYSARSHKRVGQVIKEIRTPSGQTIGEVVEYAHDTAIANNLLLSKSNGPTKPADHATLSAEGQTPPRIPQTAEGK